jgi:hypothetical protein
MSTTSSPDSKREEEKKRAVAEALEEHKKTTAAKVMAELTLAGAPRQVRLRALASAYGLQPTTKNNFDPDAASVRADLLQSRPPKPPMIVDGLLPRSHGVESAVGGAGKTTRHIWEAAHIILGRPLYGREVKQRGGVLVLTKEDDKELFEWRVAQVLEALNLSEIAKREVLRELRIHYLTGTEERLVDAGPAGSLARTDLAERIVRSYEVEGLALVELDPLNYFGPGERFVNDGEAAVLSAMAFISLNLGAACRATAHMSKVGGREGISDAHSGRGGASLGDNSRFVWNFWRHDPERDRGADVPAKLEHAANSGDLYRLHIAKLSADRPAHGALWVARSGFSFDWHPEDIRTPQDRAADALEADGHKILAYLRAARARGAYHSLRDLQGESQAVNIGQRKIQAAVSRLLAKGLLTDEPLPAHLCKGRRQSYLEPAPEAALDPREPIFDEGAAREPAADTRAN